MLNIKELRQKHADAKNAMLAIHNAAKGQGRKFTPREDTQYATLRDERDKLQAQIIDTERELDKEREEAGRAFDLRTGRITQNGPATGKRFKDMFPSASKDWGAFESKEEFFAVLSSGRFDERLLTPDKSAVYEASSHSTNVDGAGGYSVPAPLVGWLLDNSLESEIVRPRAAVYPMTSGTRKAPAWDSKTRSDGSAIGGFELAWLNEATTATDQVGRLRLIELSAHKGAIFSKVSRELAQDGLDFGAQLSAAMVKSLSFGLDHNFIRGTGVGQPLGVLNAECLVTVSKETGQAADTIVYENLTKMYSRMLPSSIPNSVWLVSSTAIPQLLQLSVSVGTGGSHIPVLSESNGQLRMLTRPVIVTEHCSSIGDLGDILFCDFSAYIVGLRQDATIEQSIHPGWQTDEISYRTIIRVDGQPALDAAITPAHSSQTLSTFVTLAAR